MLPQNRHNLHLFVLNIYKLYIVILARTATGEVILACFSHLITSGRSATITIPQVRIFLKL